MGGVNDFHEKLKDGATNDLNLSGVVVPTDIVTMDRKQYAAFLEDNWEIIDDVSVLLSGRVDHSENFGAGPDIARRTSKVPGHNHSFRQKRGIAGPVLDRALNGFH